MSDSEEVIPEKKGRGRPAAEKSDKVTCWMVSEGIGGRLGLDGGCRWILVDDRILLKRPCLHVKIIQNTSHR